MIWIKLQCSSKESNCLHIASANESDLWCYDYNRLIEICQFREMVKREKIKMTRHIFLHLFPPKMVFFETSNKVLEGFKSAMFPSLISTSLNFHDLTLKWSFSLPLSLIAVLKILGSALWKVYKFQFFSSFVFNMIMVSILKAFWQLLSIFTSYKMIWKYPLNII